MRALGHLLSTAGGAWELLRIALTSRGKAQRYWAWRRETAFGSHAHVKKSTNSLSPRDKRHAVLRFGMWVFRMRRFR